MTRAEKIVRQVIMEAVDEGMFADMFKRDYDMMLPVGSGVINAMVNGLKEMGVKFQIGNRISGGGNYLYFKNSHDYETAEELYDELLGKTYRIALENKRCKKQTKRLY